MKKILTLLLASLISLSSGLFAGVNITKVDKVSPNDEIFMDMAVAAAKSKGLKSGAVIILNGAWRATGTPTATMSAEEDAFSKARRNSLENATVYTVNEPATETVNFLNSLGVKAIYFVNPRDAVVAAGIYPASAYDDAAVDTSVNAAPMILLPFSDGEALLKK